MEATCNAMGYNFKEVNRLLKLDEIPTKEIRKTKTSTSKKITYPYYYWIKNYPNHLMQAKHQTSGFQL